MYPQIENVLRQDLAERFCKTLKDVSEKLWKKERLFPHEINLKPQIGFHGTLTSNLPSIGKKSTEIFYELIIRHKNLSYSLNFSILAVSF